MTRQLALLLHSNGFTLLRQRRHMVWQHGQSKKILVTAKTPSDRLAERNVRAELRRFLRINACGGGA
jgi:hypothetical protein